ncbi:hypothetical protein [Streptomyces althioticus]|uniref:hypothetical protein n=1 Tax=Streptomyces althioticus TaxID=83380 RepID=UPI003318CA2F
MSLLSEWLKPEILGAALVGYVGFRLQAAYERRQESKRQVREAARALSQGFKDYLVGPDRPFARLTELGHAVALIPHRKLRERLEWDLDHLRSAELNSQDPQLTQNLFGRDAMDCAAAAARGDRLPDPPEDVQFHLFQLVIREAENPRLPPGAIDMGPGEEPEVDAELLAFHEWRRRTFRGPWRISSRHRVLLRHTPLR